LDHLDLTVSQKISTCKEKNNSHPSNRDGRKISRGTTLILIRMNASIKYGLREVRSLRNIPAPLVTIGETGSLTGRWLDVGREIYVRIAAPEGFSVHRTGPAHTTSELADSQTGLLVSINALLIVKIMPQREMVVNQYFQNSLNSHR
jgi:hypothetical protein